MPNWKAAYKKLKEVRKVVKKQQISKVVAKILIFSSKKIL